MMIFQYCTVLFILKQFGVIVEAFDERGNVVVGTFYEVADFPKSALLYAFADHPHVNVSYTDYARLEADNPFTAYHGVCSMVMQNAEALFGLQSSNNFDIVQQISNRKKIPLILTRWINNQKLIPETTISLFPDPDWLNKAFFDIVNNLKWTSCTLLYTDSESLVKMSRFLELARGAGIAVYLANPDPGPEQNYRHVLKKLKKKEQKNFVISGPEKYVKEVLVQFQRAAMFTVGYSYIIADINVVRQDLEQFIESEAEITLVQLKTTDDTSKLYTLSRNICEWYQNISDEGCVSKFGFSVAELDVETLLTVDAVSMLTDIYLSYKGDIDNPGLNCDSDDHYTAGALIISAIHNHPGFTGLTGPIGFGRNGYRNKFELDIRQFREHLIANATWSPQNGYVQDKAEEEIPSNNSTHFIIGIHLGMPYAFLIDNLNPLQGNERYAGFVVDMIKEISLIAGFNYTLQPTENYYGHFDPIQMKWSGMIGQLLNQEIDLIVGDMTITAERASVVDFTLPFFTTGLSILFQKPKQIPPHFLHFAQPFSTQVWISIGLAYLLSSVSLFIVGRLCQTTWTKSKINGETYMENSLTLCNTIWFITGSLFRQTTHIKISSIPARIIVASWWIICFITVAMYISISARVEIIPEEVVLFKDAQELVTKYEYHGIKFGAVRGGATDNFFQTSTSVLYQEIGAHMESHPEQMVNIIAEGIRAAEEENYAFFTDALTIEYVVRRHCSLAQYGSLLDQRGFGIAVRHNFSYLAALDRAILKLTSNGKIGELKRKWWEENLGGNQCDYVEDVEVSPRHLVHLTGLFTITLIGTLVAVITAFLEFFWHVWKKSTQTSTGFKKTLFEHIQTRFGFTIQKPIEQNEEEPLEQVDEQHGETVELL